VADTAIALSLVRKAKSEAKASMKAEVSRAVVSGAEASMARLAAIAGDLKATGAIAELTFTPGGDAISVDVTLA
jgi:valyl-tRNA synthetase